MSSTNATRAAVSTTVPGRRATDGLHDLIGRYSHALAAGDVATIVAAWDVPSLVIGEKGVISFDTRDELERFFTASTAEYDPRGRMGPRVRVSGLERIAERLATVRLSFPYLDRYDREMGEESSTLTLRRDELGWKIRVALMHGATSHPHA